MFNERGYSLSDIAAVNGRNSDGFFGGDSAWWIILLFMFVGWGNGNGFGGNGAGNARDAVSYGFDINNLENGIRGIQNGLADGFYETKYLILKCYLFEQFIKFVFGYLQMSQTEVY